VSTLPYILLYKDSVAKDLKKLPLEVRRLVVKKILALVNNPRPAGSTKLQGSDNLYRIRQADYRIVYRIDQGELIILIIKVGHRKEIYRDF